MPASGRLPDRRDPARKCWQRCGGGTGEFLSLPASFSPSPDAIADSLSSGAKIAALVACY